MDNNLENQNNSDNEQQLNSETQRPLAVITGASSGIGYELAKVFAENGFDLFVVAESDGIVEAADAFRRLGAQVDHAQVDLTRQAAVDELFSKLQDLPAPIDTLVLNAGVGLGGEFAETDPARDLEIIKLNVMSPVYLTRLVLPLMIEQGHGRILFTSSIAADMPGPFESVYAASKAFVQSFSEAIRHEVKDKGITVTALQPGPTETNFFNRADMLDTKAGSGKKDDASKVAQQGFDALMDGEDHVVAGSLMNKIQSVLAKFMPQTGQATAHAGQTKPQN